MFHHQASSSLEENTITSQNVVKPQPLMGIQFSPTTQLGPEQTNNSMMSNLMPIGLPNKNLLVTNWMLEDCQKSLSAMIDSSRQHIDGNVTDDENISMCLSKSFENNSISDSFEHSREQNKTLEVPKGPFNYNYDPTRMETTPYLEQLEKRIDIQLNECIVKLNADIEDLLMFSKDANNDTHNSEICKDDIENRLVTLRPLQTAIFSELCNATDVGIELVDKKKVRAEKISTHMPRLLAFLGFDILQLKVIIQNDMSENAYRVGIERLTDWFNEILQEGGGKWCHIWPRCISTSAFSEILVNYFYRIDR